MSTLAEKVADIKEKYVRFTESFDQDDFKMIMTMLKPCYDLPENDIVDIFIMSDENNNGYITKDQLIKILDTIVLSEQSQGGDGNTPIEAKKSVNFTPEHNPFDEENDVSRRLSRGTIYIGGDRKMTLNSQKAIGSTKTKKLSSDFLAHLTADKISEIKYLFKICNKEEQGATIHHILQVSRSINNMACSQEEIETIFYFLNDEKLNKVTPDAFSNLMSEFEKRLLDYFQNSEISFQDFEKKPEPSHSRASSTFNESAMQLNIDDSDGSEISEADNQEETDEMEIQHTDAIQQCQLIIEKSDQGVDAINQKNSKLVSPLLSDIMDIAFNLQKKFKIFQEKIRILKDRTIELKQLDEMKNSRVGSMEIELKKMASHLNTLIAQNDQLFEENQKLQQEIKEKEGLAAEFDQKNAEIVKLERRVRENQDEKNKLNDQIKKVTQELDRLKESYQQLNQLYQQQDKKKKSFNTNEGEDFEIEDMENYIGEKAKIEVEELRHKTKSQETKINELEQLVLSLQEEINNQKDFSEGLKLEKNDIQSKFERLQEETETLRQENANNKKSSLTLAMLEDQQSQKRQGTNSNNLSDIADVNFFEYRKTLVNKLNRADLQDIQEEQEDEKDEQAATTEKQPPTKQQKEENKSNESSKIEEKNKNQLQKSLTISQDSKSNEEVPQMRKRDSKTISVASNLSPTRADSSPRKLANSPNVMINKKKRLQSKDFLALRQKTYVVNLLEKQDEKFEDDIIYSDNITRINSSNQKEFRVLLITSKAMYCMNPKKDYKIVRVVPIESIYQITISKGSAGIMAIHVKNDYDYLIDTCRRFDLVLFFQSLFDYKNLKQLTVIHEKGFLLKNRGENQPKHLHEHNKVLNPELQSTYKNAVKYGNIYIKKDSFLSFIQDPWKMCPCFLTELGLVLLQKHGSSKIEKFIPVIGYIIIDRGDKDSYGKYAFKIKYPHGNIQHTLACDSEILKKEWIKEIHKVQEKSDEEKIKKASKQIKESKF